MKSNAPNRRLIALEAAMCPLVAAMLPLAAVNSARSGNVSASVGYAAANGD